MIAFQCSSVGTARLRDQTKAQTPILLLLSRTNQEIIDYLINFSQSRFPQCCSYTHKNFSMPKNYETSSAMVVETLRCCLVGVLYCIFLHFV